MPLDIGGTDEWLGGTNKWHPVTLCADTYSCCYTRFGVSFPELYKILRESFGTIHAMHIVVLGVRMSSYSYISLELTTSKEIR